MLSLKNGLLVTASTIGLLSLGGAVSFANAQENRMPPQGQHQQVDVSDAHLQEFVKAQAAVSQIQAQFQAQAADISSQTEMTALRQQANEQMVQVIQQTDLNIEQYNQIASAVQTDPNVRERYIEMVQ
ncbi:MULTISPECIES: DUF4168 domain-containing protein [unclassified Iodidimonas]|uniref:DUF4168 domain-containing protein n=1 Tax=unclassified Iodidimonas TaxID=2626145 RepID=UPI0024828D21|nr:MULTISPECIES: DUF4168 domain-containing protein [unclassified Iodidimonas]